MRIGPFIHCAVMTAAAWWPETARETQGRWDVPYLPCSLLLFGYWITSDSLWPHGLQHTRLSCPLLSPRVCSNSCPLSQRCHSAISSSVVPFSSHLQSFPASGSFPVSQLFTSGGQSIGASASASVLSMNSQGCDNFTGCTHLSELEKFYALLYMCFIAYKI